MAVIGLPSVGGCSVEYLSVWVRLILSPHRRGYGFGKYTAEVKCPSHRSISGTHDTHRPSLVMLTLTTWVRSCLPGSAP